MNFLIFDIKDYRYGIEIGGLERIIEKQQALYHLPIVPSFIKGMINFQGRIITAIDLAELFQMTDSDEKNFLLISKDMNNIGYLVKKVVGVIELDEQSIEKVDKFDLRAGDEKFVKSIAKGRMNELISLIDLGSLEEFLKNPKHWSSS